MNNQTALVNGATLIDCTTAILKAFPMATTDVLTEQRATITLGDSRDPNRGTLLLVRVGHRTIRVYGRGTTAADWLLVDLTCAAIGSQAANTTVQPKRARNG